MRKLSLLLLLLTTVAAYGDVTGPVAPPGGSGGGGSVNFSQVLSGTNTNTLTMGTGGDFEYGTGIVDANQVVGMPVTGTSGSGPLVFGTSPSLTTPNIGAATASALTLSGITGSTQCLHVNTSGVVSGTGLDCGAGGSGPTLQTNGTNNSSQTALNIENGAGISCTNPSAGNVQCSQTAVNRTVTTTTDTITSADLGGIVFYNSASSVAVTVPQATGTFGNSSGFTVEDIGTANAVLTPTTSTINGASSLTVAPGTGCSVISDGTNWKVASCTALLANFLNAAGSQTTWTPVCKPGVRLTVNTVTATGNLTTNAPTGCSEGQQVLVKIAYSASITYTWNASYHASASGPGALPTASGGTSGVDFFTFYDDAANSHFDYLAGVPGF